MRSWQERAYLLGWALALLIATRPATAQNHPNLGRGQGGIASDGVDTVRPFNGNLALRIPLGLSYPVNGGLSYGLELRYDSEVWESEPFGDNTATFPNRVHNAGLGWMLSLGQLNPPTPAASDDLPRNIYMSPDGARHVFYPTLHEGETATPGVEYTRDGTYLRLKTGLRQVEFPDGSVHEFNTSGFPTRIRDSFNNLVSNAITISYVDPLAWVITDPHRTQRIVFRSIAGIPGVSKAIDHIELSAFGGATAIYSFRYNIDDGAPVSLTGCSNTEPTFANRPALLLTQVLLPDGSTYSMPASDYYNDLAPVCRSGRIKRLTLPTLGKVEWDYTIYRYPTESSFLTWVQGTVGVGLRRLLDANGAPLGDWTYATTLSPAATPGGPRTELVNTLTNPLGHKVIRYFSVCANPTLCSLSRLAEYGLPISRDRAGDGAGRLLSEELLDSSNNVQRRIFRRFENDLASTSTRLTDQTRLNQRLASERILHLDDGTTFEEMTMSDFDGVGHYRTSTTGGNFPGSNVRTVQVAFNNDRGTYGQPSYIPWPASSAWILGTFASQTTTEGPFVEHRTFCTDTTGFTTRQRIHSANGTGRSNNDVVLVAAHDASGNVTSESFFGGDTQPINTVTPNNDLCQLALPASPTYRIDHGYSFGRRASSQFAGVGGASLLNAAIDQRTGLIRRTSDTALLNTTYDYDAMGRLLRIQPAQDGQTIRSYERALSPTQLARLVMSRTNNTGSTELVRTRTTLDAFGRTVLEEKRRTNGAWVNRRMNYNVLGWLTYSSEWDSVTLGTAFSDFDIYGRPRRIRPADGAAHDITTSYAGARSMSRTAQVATGATETSATTTEVYDRHGRLHEVVEPNGTVTRYEYDAGNRIRRICQHAIANSCGQQRLFSYDSRGWMLSETHPEKGASGNGLVQYFDFDAFGNAGRRLDGPSHVRILRDAAARVIEIREASGLQRPLKTFTYATANGTNDFVRGKMQSASRHNYVGAPFNADAQVTQTYSYGGRQGRVSQRDTALFYNGAPRESFRQGFAWDELGNQETLFYPDCLTVVGCTFSLRTVSFGYTEDRLTSIPGYAVNITYHANELVNQVFHTNGVVDTQQNDPSLMPRPAGFISSLGTATLFNEGSYSYDGSGNVRTHGGDVLTYDSLSRLVQGTLTKGGSEQYAYDRFGNLTSLTRDGIVYNTPTSSTTNRLTGAVSYDAAGNLLSWNLNSYEYDAFNQMTRFVTGTNDRRFVYGPDDERFWSFKVGGAESLWALRDLSGRILREYEAHVSWQTHRDYIYRGGALLASEHPTKGTTHLTVDHLGSVRLITDSLGNSVGVHRFFSYGTDRAGIQEAEQMKFTGHERDLGDPASDADDLDNMHARFYNHNLGRFTSVEPNPGRISAPQTFNRYAYVAGSPRTYVDPDGRSALLFSLVNHAYLAGLYERRGSLQFSASAGALFGGGVSTDIPKLETLDVYAGYNVGESVTLGPNFSFGKVYGPYLAGSVSGGAIVGGSVQIAVDRDFGFQLDITPGLAEGFDLQAVAGLNTDIAPVEWTYVTVREGFGNNGPIVSAEYRWYADGRRPTVSGDLRDEANRYFETWYRVGLFFWTVAAHSYHTGQFVSASDLFLSGAYCVEGICAY